MVRAVGPAVDTLRTHQAVGPVADIARAEDPAVGTIELEFVEFACVRFEFVGSDIRLQAVVATAATDQAAEAMAATVLMAAAAEATTDSRRQQIPEWALRAFWIGSETTSVGM